MSHAGRVAPARRVAGSAPPRRQALQDGSVTILVGTSGWTYDSWAGPFYPDGVPRRRWLEFYAAHLRTVELNASHYRWPRDSVFQGWHDRLPAGFEMTVK